MVNKLLRKFLIAFAIGAGVTWLSIKLVEYFAVTPNSLGYIIIAGIVIGLYTLVHEHFFK